jgi:hypothetical protein
VPSLSNEVVEQIASALVQKADAGEDSTETTERSLQLESGETVTLIQNQQLAEVLIEASFTPENWQNDLPLTVAEQMLRLNASDRFGGESGYSLTPDDSIAVTGTPPGDSPEVLTPFLENLLTALRAPLPLNPGQAEPTSETQEEKAWTRI